MTRNPDIRCGSCGRPMWSSNGRSLPEGQATCRECRRERRAQARPPKPEVTRWCVRCGAEFSTARATKIYCTVECREAGRSRRPRATTSERGYGAAHKKERQRWADLMAEAWAQGEYVACCLCGDAITEGEAWHLDHDPSGAGYRGPAHPRCNTSDGGRRGALVANARWTGARHARRGRSVAVVSTANEWSL